MMKKGFTFKIISVGMIFFFFWSYLISSAPYAFAARSRAGGGKLAKFSWGSFAMSAGMSVGSAIVSGALSSALKGTGISAGGLWSKVTGNINTAVGSMPKNLVLQGVPSWANTALGSGAIQNIPSVAQVAANSGILGSLGNYFSSLGSLKNVASIAISGYTTFMATSQAGRAVAMAGAYYDWKPSSVFLLSNVVSGAVGGLLNPAIALGDTMPKIPAGDILAQTAFETSGFNMAKGAFIGSLKNFAEAGVIVAIDGGRINEGKPPGALAQIGGLGAGVAAGNFARGLVNPETWHNVSKGIFKAEPNRKMEDYKLTSQAASNLGDTYLADEFAQKANKQQPYIFSTVENADVQKIKWRELSINEVNQLQGWATNPNIEFRTLGEGLVNVVDTKAQISPAQIGNRLLEATFIKTADMWPILVTRSLSIAVSSSLRENHNGLASFMSSAVEGIAYPLFSGLADIYALRPGLYIGENSLTNKFAYTTAIKELVYKYRGEKTGPEFYKAYEVHKEDPDRLRAELQKIGETHGIKIEIPEITTREDVMKWAKESIGGSIDKGMSVEKGEDLLDKWAKMPFDKASAILGIAQTQARLQIESEIKKAGTLDEVFKSAKIDKLSLAFKNATSGLKFGLIEGSIHGGVNFLTSKFSEKNDLLVAAAVSLGATLLTGAIRGVILNQTWEPAKKDGRLFWMDRISEYEPQPYKGSDWWQKKIDTYEYPIKLGKYNEFAELSGLKLKDMTKNVYDLEKSVWIEEKTRGYELRTFDEKPKIKDSIIHSLIDSNYTFLKRAVAFGTPQIPAKLINTLVMSDYFRRLNSYAMAGAGPDWLTSGINSEILTASSFSSSNNILTSLSAINSMANAFNLERRRQTWTTSPNFPMIMQGLDYKPWALAIETRYYLTYEALAKSRTGKSFLREGK
jgi:hypothetical protein